MRTTLIAMSIAAFGLATSAYSADRSPSYYCKVINVVPQKPSKRLPPDIMFQFFENNTKVRVEDGAIELVIGEYIVLRTEKKKNGNMIFRWSLSPGRKSHNKGGIRYRVEFNPKTLKGTLATGSEQFTFGRKPAVLDCKIYKRTFWSIPLA